MNSFYSESELHNLGFKHVGKNVKISRFARFYGEENIEIGDNVRIDDFCILSGKIKLGNNIHISAYVALYGAMGIELKDNTGISARSTIHSAMDDFSGEFLIGPMQDETKTNVTGGKVTVERYSQIGAHCLIFPSLIIGEGCAVGACSLIRCSLDSWGIYCGIPAKRIKERSKAMLRLL